MLADLARKEVIRYSVNPEFTRAFLLFGDRSSLEFEHTSRSNRWARASVADTSADRVCRSLTQFRLNAKHLQLFFEDGSNAEFVAVPSSPANESAGVNGTSR